jgi:CRP-like cAMP-binding protein
MPNLDRSLIAGLPPFANLSETELDEVVGAARSRRYPKGDAVFEEGGDAHSFFLLLDGYVRVVRTSPDGAQVIVRYIGDGELFGIAAALGRTTYPATAIAAVDCVALVWPSHLWPSLSSRIPAFGAGTYQTIGRRLEETQARVVEMSTERVEQRVAHTLLRLIETSGRNTDQGIEIDFPLTREDIAEMTGTTLHTVSRLLSTWADDGLVTGGRQRVTVSDPQGLLRLAEGRRRG